MSFLLHRTQIARERSRGRWGVRSGTRRCGAWGSPGGARDAGAGKVEIEVRERGGGRRGSRHPLIDPYA